VNVQKLKLWDEESEFDAQKDKARFRQYEDACDRVKNFYKEQHGKAWPDCLVTTISLCLIVTPTEKQTVAFNIQARVNFKSCRRARMGIWQAMELLNTLVDESDPDVSVSHHRLQTITATDATLTRPACRRLSIYSRPLRPSVAMVSPSGCRLLGSSTTSANYFSCSTRKANGTLSGYGIICTR
jgi:hypothetical protein